MTGLAALEKISLLPALVIRCGKIQEREGKYLENTSRNKDTVILRMEAIYRDGKWVCVIRSIQELPCLYNTPFC